MYKPQYRLRSYDAIQILAKEFDYPYDKNRQDW